MHTKVFLSDKYLSANSLQRDINFCAPVECTSPSNSSAVGLCCELIIDDLKP
jgi:hypothetical protein